MGIPQVGRCGAGIVDDVFLIFICLEFPDTLDALEVEEATELEDDILDNVESVETGDIVDVLPNPPAPTPPGSNRKSVVTNIIMIDNLNMLLTIKSKCV